MDGPLFLPCRRSRGAPLLVNFSRVVAIEPLPGGRSRLWLGPAWSIVVQEHHYNLGCLIGAHIEAADGG